MLMLKIQEELDALYSPLHSTTAATALFQQHWRITVRAEKEPSWSAAMRETISLPFLLLPLVIRAHTHTHPPCK